jgi:hypothetical protein
VALSAAFAEAFAALAASRHDLRVWVC